MHKYYIINGIVEFHPAASTLRDLNNPEQVVVLNSPAGRCLLLLIERAGSIVTQQECMDIVWQRRGMMVSPNTYYQNISILRKGLKKAGFETDPIVTIPRIGLTLASDTQITIKEAQLPSAEPEAPVQTVQEEDGVPQPVAPVTPVAPVAKRRFWLGGAQLALLLIISVSVISYSRPHDREKALAYAAPFKDECSSYPWIYISGYSLLPRASVIRCDRAMTEPNRCMSDYFIQDH